MSKNIGKMYATVYTLRKKRFNLLQELKDIEKERTHISMSYLVIESDLIQEVGFTQQEFQSKQEELFKQEAILENREHEIGFKLDEIEKELLNIHKDII